MCSCTHICTCQKDGGSANETQEPVLVCYSKLNIEGGEGQWVQSYCRRIISIKEKAKVAAAACLTECIQVLAVLAS